jgi:hypothetical protein
MKKSRFSEEQIVGVLKEAEAGPNGRITGFVDRREGGDLVWRRDPSGAS